MNNMLIQQDNYENYLKCDQLINFDNVLVSTLADNLQLKNLDEVPAVKTAYEYVRDKYPHTFDAGEAEVACSASDVINLGHGVCYAKAHLLAALLRHAGIPTGICYQRLCLDSPDDEASKTANLSSDTHAIQRLVLHAVNAVFLKSLNKWVRMDARGNTNGINAQFNLEHEQLAFTIHPQFDEEDGLVIYSKTPASVAHALSSGQYLSVFHQR